MVADSDLKPIAEGNFRKTPFAHILVFLLEKRMNGSLDVKQGNTEICIYFRDGIPAKIRSNVPQRELGQVLVMLNEISDDQLDTCNKRLSKTGSLQGQTLLELAMVDVKTLVKGLMEQMLLKLTDVFALTKATYAFFEDINKLSGFGPDEVFPVHTYPVLMAGIRAYSEKLNLDAVLTTIHKKWVYIPKEKLDVIRSYRLSQKEKEVVGDLLSTPRRFEELISGKEWDPKIAKYIAYVLLITKNIGIRDSAPSQKNEAAQEKVDLTSIAPMANHSDDPQLQAIKQQLIEKAESIAVQNYYEMLGVETEATTEDVRKAFFRLAKLYHPDRIPAELKDELKEMVSYLYSNLNEAQTVLVDPVSREQYDAVLLSEEEKSKGGQNKSEEDAIRNVLEAESMYQRALVFLNQKRYDKSAELVSEARMLNPEEGEYLALAAHLDSMNIKPGASLREHVEKLRQAAEQCPKSERVNFFFAEILKRAGRVAEARTYFEKTLLINPHNIEAARTIRLMDMEAKQKEEKKSNGIFRRFFK